MDLTGKLIKGTGSYEVKEIAPPSESGQLVTNPYFTNDLSSWTNSDGAWSWVAGTAVSDGAGSGRLYQGGALVSGKTYRLKVVCLSHTGTGDLRVYLGGGSSTQYTDILSAGTFTYIGVSSGTILFMQDISGDFNGAIDSIEIEEVPEGYPLKDAGKTYLECTSDGTIFFPSKQAYGEWEFDLYKGGGSNVVAVYITNNSVPVADNRYTVVISSGEALYFYQNISSLCNTGASYIGVDVWYRIKITRTLDGKFYLYIKGGDYGTVDWALIAVTGGSNPVTDNTHTETRYFGCNFDTGDRIANIVMRPAVKQ